MNMLSSGQVFLDVSVSSGSPIHVVMLVGSGPVRRHGSGELTHSMALCGISRSEVFFPHPSCHEEQKHDTKFVRGDPPVPQDPMCGFALELVWRTLGFPRYYKTHLLPWKLLVERTEENNPLLTYNSHPAITMDKEGVTQIERVVASPHDEVYKPDTLTLVQGLRRYPKVASYCLLLTTTILLWGFDLAMVGNLAGLDQFKWVSGRQQIPRY